jgi:FKBP-type peptidyl-prolyl cis-trans isomerase
MLEIQHIPKVFMIYKGDLVDQFGGVPQDSSKIHDFFKKAQGFADGSDEGEKPQSENQKDDSQTASKSGFIVEKLNQGEGPTVPNGAYVKVHYTGKLMDGTVFDSSVKRGPFEF